MLLRFLLITFFTTMTVFSQQPTIEPGVSRDLARWRAAKYSDVRYGLNLTLEKKSPVLKGVMEIRVTVHGDSSPTEIILDWRKISGKEELSTISNVYLNGNPAKFEEISEHIVIRDVPVGDNIVKLDFTSPILPSGGAITRYIDREDQGEYIYSLFVPSDASTAFPVFDQPDLKARFALKATLPPNWQMVSNTRLFSTIEEVNDGHDGKSSRSFYVFEETKPISTYVFAFSAGDFEVFKECLVRPANIESVNACLKPGAEQNRETSQIYVRRSQSEKFRQHAKEIFRLNREGVSFLESYFDYKYPFPKYDLVLIPEFPFGGMEHAGATFLREESIIFPQEPTANNYISRANLIFHEAAHQWFGDTVTMRWFDDLWLKEGFAEFMAYKTLEKVMPEYNAWKVFYERNKQAAYQTDATRGTTPIYQEIPNLSSAKSAYGNIVYRKAPSFLRQAEFYIGAEKFQKAVRAFLKGHEYANAGWEDLVKDLEIVKGEGLGEWAEIWVKMPGLFKIGVSSHPVTGSTEHPYVASENYESLRPDNPDSIMAFKILVIYQDGSREERGLGTWPVRVSQTFPTSLRSKPRAIIPNYQDYGYGIFLMDEKSKKYVLENIQNEKDEFLRTMMWGSLWDSVREAELDPKAYVELVIKNLGTENDEVTISTLLGRVSTAMNYYITRRPAANDSDLAVRLESLLLARLQTAKTLGQKLTFYRAFLNTASTDNARKILKEILREGAGKPVVKEGISPAAPAAPGPFGMPALKTKDKFDIVTKLIILDDPEAAALLAGLEKTETTDEAKRYAYAAKAGFATAANKAKFFEDFVGNKEISESWIEAAFGPFNSVRQSDLTLPYLEKALAELPNLKRSRKIFFVNGWLGAFIGGQRSEAALAIVTKFLADNQGLDRDLRLKILENMDVLERAAKIQRQFGQSVTKPQVNTAPKKKPARP